MVRKKKKRKSIVPVENESRRVRGMARKDAAFPVPASRSELPKGYAGILRSIKHRIQEERLRVVLSANSAMVILYWDIGCMILARQESEGWGAKVIDRLSYDLRQEYPDMKGLSPRNLKYMRAFAAAWPDRAIVQRVIAQIPWRQNIALLERLGDSAQTAYRCGGMGDEDRRKIAEKFTGKSADGGGD